MMTNKMTNNTRSSLFGVFISLEQIETLDGHPQRGELPRQDHIYIYSKYETQGRNMLVRQGHKYITTQTYIFSHEHR